MGATGEGIHVSEAREIVDAIVQVCVEGLQWDKVLETPLRLFQAVRAPAARQAVRFGKKVTLYKKPWRVRFTQDPALCTSGAPPEVPEVEKRSKSMSDAEQCPKCLSEWLMLGEFRRYQEAYSAYPGGEIIPVEQPAFRLAVCLCGYPLLPSKIRRTSSVDGLTDFLAAVQATAQEHRAAAAAIQDPDEVLAMVATKAELEQLQERIRELLKAEGIKQT